MARVGRSIAGQVVASAAVAAIVMRIVVVPVWPGSCR